jgi:hypothetical protein
MMNTSFFVDRLDDFPGALKRRGAFETQLGAGLRRLPGVFNVQRSTVEDTRCRLEISEGSVRRLDGVEMD